jgi:hypothetical protein
VTSHVRSCQRGTHTTLPEHMPKSHRAHAEWSPKRLIQRGASIGASTGAIVGHLLRSKAASGVALLGLSPAPGARPPVRRAAPGGSEFLGLAAGQPNPQERQVDLGKRPGSTGHRTSPNP